MTAPFVAESPIHIERLSNKKIDPPARRYLYVGFPDVRPRRFYDPRLADNPYKHEHVRWYKGGYEYGGDNLTEEGKALFDALLALPEALAGTIWELWLPWNWRDEFGDFVRIEYDIDYEPALVWHIQTVLRSLYGEDADIRLGDLRV